MENKLISEIRSVLINDWDPVGIGNNPNLIDEYGGYIGLIINILMQKSDVKTIVALLKSIEITEMGNENVDIKCL